NRAPFLVAEAVREVEGGSGAPTSCKLAPEEAAKPRDGARTRPPAGPLQQHDRGIAAARPQRTGSTLERASEEPFSTPAGHPGPTSSRGFSISRTGCSRQTDSWGKQSARIRA